MWEHINCKECDESPTGYCDAYYKAHRHYEMDRRDRATRKKWMDSHTGPSIQIRKAIAKLKWQYRHVKEEDRPITVRVQFERLYFLWQSEAPPLPPEKIIKRWDRFQRSWSEQIPPGEDSALNWEFVAELKRQEREASWPYLDEMIAACKEVGVASDDPYLIDLQRQRRELRRKAAGDNLQETNQGQSGALLKVS